VYSKVHTLLINLAQLKNPAEPNCPAQGGIVFRNSAATFERLYTRIQDAKSRVDYPGILARLF
jgi:hypothetical protein